MNPTMSDTLSEIAAFHEQQADEINRKHRNLLAADGPCMQIAIRQQRDMHERFAMFLRELAQILK